MSCRVVEKTIVSPVYPVPPATQLVKSTYKIIDGDQNTGLNIEYLFNRYLFAPSWARSCLIVELFHRITWRLKLQIGSLSQSLD